MVRKLVKRHGWRITGIPSVLKDTSTRLFLLVTKMKGWHRDYRNSVVVDPPYFGLVLDSLYNFVKLACPVPPYSHPKIKIIYNIFSTLFYDF